MRANSKTQRPNALNRLVAALSWVGGVIRAVVAGMTRRVRGLPPSPPPRPDKREEKRRRKALVRQMRGMRKAA